ncbi:hypothetical protein KSP39_PZI019337 [Platanthera zijinensis]|uniref:CMP/dCMP-type deaminase domain-containing protein n=1 Tax=Platanthera zijinensis TaxID=2320716 RepID=A0AAP0B216_9ASPA
MLLPVARKLARPPISGFHVGAAALGVSGRIYLSANVEFPGVPLHHSIHAEQFLITNASLHAEQGIRFIAVSDEVEENREICNNGLGLVDERLREAAFRAARASHAPYSGSPSGFSLADIGGRVYAGSYTESAAYNPILGPVQAAIVAYLVAGGGDDGGGVGEGIVAAALAEMEGALVS